jgi:hypothetical protein
MHDAVSSMDPFLELAAYKGPVLILHGTSDSVVNYRYSIRAQMEYGTDRCSLALIDEADHGFNESQKKSSFGRIRQFLRDSKEILNIRVILTHTDHIDDTISKVYFTAYCDNDFFSGTTTGEGCDTQTKQADGSVKLHAEYTLFGRDAEGHSCSISIVNKEHDGEWKPAIRTDSSSLSFLNGADLTAVLEFSSAGPRVRVFAPQEAVPCA